MAVPTLLFLRHLFLRCLFISALLAAVPGSAWAGNFEDAMLAKEQSDHAKALSLLRPLAAQGDANSQFQLSLMYANGQGVPMDIKESLRWLRSSAKRGNASAQSNLGAAYSRGRGVAQDYVRAYVWFSLAAASGSREAATNRDVAQRRMTAQQLVQAKEMAAACLQQLGPQGCD